MALSEEKQWFHPSFGPCVSQAVLSKVPEHLHVPWTSQGRCLSNYCCCSSPLGACQAPNAACHVSSASQASRPAGQHSLDGSVFPGLQDVSCGAVQQQPPCSAPPRCWVGAAEPEPRDREAESSRAAVWGIYPQPRQGSWGRSILPTSRAAPSSLSTSALQAGAGGAGMLQPWRMSPHLTHLGASHPNFRPD